MVTGRMNDLPEKPDNPDRDVRVETGAKRIRVVFGGSVVADTTRPLLVWEVPYYPTYYVPRADVRGDVLTPTGHTRHSTGLGDGRLFTVRVGTREAAGAALSYEDSPVESVRDAVRFDWPSMDAWFEEDEQVHFHARDPGVRVDILDSSRQVRVEIAGTTIAESTRPKLLFETGLPTRCYLPKTDLRLDLLEPTSTVTHCPYKGSAEYWSARIGDRVYRDVAWSYRNPLPESQKIAGLVSFLGDEVDVYVNGTRQ